MTIQNIIDEITKEIGGDSTDTTLSTNLLSFCTAALRRIPKRIRDRAIVKIDSVTLSAAAQTASLPTDFLKERMVWRIESGRRVPIDKSHFKKFNTEEYSSSGSGAPAKYRIYGSVIEFDTPADQAYTIYFEYFYALTTTTITTASTFALKEDAVEPYKDLVKALYYEYEEDDDRADRLWKRGFAFFQDLDDEYTDEEFGTHIEET